MSDETVLTAEEVATILRTSLRTVRNLIKSGRLRGIKVGRGYRIPREALEEYLRGEEPKSER